MKANAATPTVVDEILQLNRDRKPALVRLKLERMKTDAFAFFRGTDHLFAAAWPKLHPAEVGPAILICGDLHLENFGAYRTESGEFLYDINDFDEALVAPCSLDLVRCTTSILLAAQLWQLTPVEAMRTVLAFLDRYRTTVTKSVVSSQVHQVALGTGQGPVWSLLGKAAQGDRAQFLDQHTEATAKGGRRIRRKADRCRSIGTRRTHLLRAAVEQYGRKASRPESFDVLDVVWRIAGIGSLGVRRYAVLIAGEGAPDGYRLLDIKEARPSALLGCAGEPQPDPAIGDAQRIVQAQRRLQAQTPVGLDLIDVGGEMYRMRELIPAENRATLDRLREDPKKLRRAVAVAGRLTAWAHLRGSRLDAEDRSGRLAEWAGGPGLDAVIASAIRFADRTRRDYRTFRAAMSKKGFSRRIEAAAESPK